MLKIGEELKNVIKSTIKEDEKILYDNPAGTAGNVTLSDSIYNYEYIEIFYYSFSSSTRRYGSVKVHFPLGKRVLLQSSISQSGNSMIISEELNVSEYALTVINNNTRVVYGTGVGGTAQNEMFITRVIGYK